MAGEASTLTRGRLTEHPLWSRATGATDLAGRLVLPAIVSASVEDRETVEGAPGGSRIERVSITELVRDARSASHMGMAGMLLMSASDRKDEHALIASERDHVVVRAIRAVKHAVPDLGVATDVCVCSHTAHGQCVLFAIGAPDIEATHIRLAEIAVVHADAGADLIVLSGMLRGGAAAVRRGLDEAGYVDLPVAATLEVDSSYAAIERRAIGALPIRERAVPLLPAADDGTARARALREVVGPADAVVVRPAGIAHDLVTTLSGAGGRAVIAYHPADERALYAAALAGELDAEAAERDSVIASRRAGASLIVSFGARSIAAS